GARLIARLRLTNMSPQLIQIMEDESLGIDCQAAAVQSLIALRPHAAAAPLAAHIADASLSAPQRERILAAIASDSDDRIRDTLAEVMRQAPERLQREIAAELAEQRNGAEALLAVLENGSGTARVLQDESIAQKLQLAAPRDAAKRIAAL